MQLRPKKKRKIGKFLANATVALLCNPMDQALAEDIRSDESELKSFITRNINEIKQWAKWSGEIGFLGYSETQGRVQAIEPAIKLDAKFVNDRVWSTKLVFDSLTGASPNGALNSGQPQTFTSPSGSASYTISPGEQPLYSQFRDTRVNLGTSWSEPLSRSVKWNIGFNGSTEYDYLSLGLNTALTKESEDKNQSWTVGLSYTTDTVRPVGGVPTPLAAMVAPHLGPLRSGSVEQKDTYDILLGYSQVMSRSWIMQGNISLGYSQGYMNDPYKFVTIFEDSNLATLGDPVSYIHEKRPDKRFKRSLYLASKKFIQSGILNVGYRYSNDDWGIQAHTVDFSYNFAVSGKWRIEPGLRYYNQSAVDFYSLAIGNSQATPVTITSDYRLGDLTALTPGLKIINKLKDEKEIALILRYYMQHGDLSSFNPVGSMQGQNLIPDTNAYILQVHYIF